MLAAASSPCHKNEDYPTRIRRLFSRGEVALVSHLYDCFQEFSAASGLIANTSKSSIYFGVSLVVQEKIWQRLEFARGKLSFKYLGVPLSTKMLSVMQCQPLIDKMIDRITTWAAKLLTYTGRVQLIKSVLFLIQTFWSQILILPKKILSSNKSPISWEQKR